jgi:hypothetical protein
MIPIVGEKSLRSSNTPTSEIERPGGAVIHVQEEVAVDVLKPLIRACQQIQTKGTIVTVSIVRHSVPISSATSLVTVDNTVIGIFWDCSSLACSISNRRTRVPVRWRPLHILRNLCFIQDIADLHKYFFETPHPFPPDAVALSGINLDISFVHFAILGLRLNVSTYDPKSYGEQSDRTSSSFPKLARAQKTRNHDTSIATPTLLE